MIQYTNCPECRSDNIEAFTSGWHCHTCGYSWSAFTERSKTATMRD